MSTFAFNRYALCISIAAALLAGCGRSQVPIGAPAAMSEASAPHHTSSGTYRVLYRFHPPRGSHPAAGLLDLNGALYGTTAAGGAGCGLSGCGTVYSVTANGVEKVLYAFKGGSDGSAPESSLLNVNGTLYGTTSTGGGPNGYGTVFSITLSGTETVLYSFKGGSGDGFRPCGGLINVDGALYGTTCYGGANDMGTVFKITTPGTETVLHSFGGSGDGAYPLAGLLNARGALYGTTQHGGTYDEGTFFSISMAGKEHVLYSFGGNLDGGEPLAGLIDVKGTLYGTTEAGGTYNYGTVFSITTTGGEQVLHSFGSGPDGVAPEAGLINVDGILYGTTAQGGDAGYGTIYSVTPTGSETVLRSFAGRMDGRDPTAPLTSVNGKLYGTAVSGGSKVCRRYGCGTVFALTP